MRYLTAGAVGILFFAIALIANAQTSKESDTETGYKNKEDAYPRLETTPIRPSRMADCKSTADCEAIYRMPMDKLNRLRALDRAAPGKIIQLSPRRQRHNPRTRSASGRKR